MTYFFDMDEAKEIGLNEAIIVSSLRFWIMKNKALSQHFHEGHTWTYNSMRGFITLFPFWTEFQIRHAIDSLKKQDVIITGNFNETAYDRTTWYAFKDESIWLEKQIHLGKIANGFAKNSGPIPDIIPDIIPREKKEGELFGEEAKTQGSQRIVTDCFQSEFFRACGSKPTWNARIIKTVKTLIAEHDSDEICSTIKKFFLTDEWWFAKNGSRSFLAFAQHYDEILSAKITRKGKAQRNTDDDAFLEGAAAL